MEFKIDEKYVITSTSHDFVLSELRTIKEGKNAGQETRSTVGYFTKLGQLVTYLIAHDIKGSSVESLCAMDSRINELAKSIEDAFSTASA